MSIGKFDGISATKSFGHGRYYCIDARAKLSRSRRKRCPAGAKARENLLRAFRPTNVTSTWLARHRYDIIAENGVVVHTAALLFIIIVNVLPILKRFVIILFHSSVIPIPHESSDSDNACAPRHDDNNIISPSGIEVGRKKKTQFILTVLCETIIYYIMDCCSARCHIERCIVQQRRGVHIADICTAKCTDTVGRYEVQYLLYLRVCSGLPENFLEVRNEYGVLITNGLTGNKIPIIFYLSVGRFSVKIGLIVSQGFNNLCVSYRSTST